MKKLAPANFACKAIQKKIEDKLRFRNMWSLFETL
jgi:hypothetical protein